MSEIHHTPLISVIIIFLNAEKFIEEAIESVLAQTETDWELVLVDDGSTDGSTGIARDYARRQPDRIRYLQHPGHRNRGMSASRNLGIANARGEFIAFLDADDVWLPRRLERHVAVMREHEDVGMVYGPTLYWYSWQQREPGRDGPRDHPGELMLEPGRPIPPPIALRTFLETGGGSLPGICSLLARRDVVQRIGGFEESFRGLYEDQVFLSKMCFQTTVYVFGEVLDRYRQHRNSHCYQAIGTGDYHPAEPHPARERYLLWLKEYLAAHEAGDPQLMAALDRELWPYRHSWSYAIKRSQAFQYAKRAAQRGLPAGTYVWLRRRLGGWLRSASHRS